MRIANNKFMLKKLIADNPTWFSKGNKKFFNDKKYFFMYSGAGNRYMVRSTFAWSDMFGQPARLHYRINTVIEDKNDQEILRIGPLLDNEFKTLNDIKNWLKQN